MKHSIITIIALTSMVLCSVIFLESGFSIYIIAGIVALYVLSTVYGVFQIKSNYFIKSVNTGKNKGVAFTFDDGPDPETTPKILAVLKAANVKATFFVIGKNAEKYPDLIRQIDEEGHTVANHSYSHHYGIGFFSSYTLTKDLAHCNKVIHSAIGKTPAFFRPPFGVTNPRFADALRSNGLNSIGWSLRSFDTRAKNKYQVIERVISNLKQRDIVLLHDNLAVTVEALEDIIELCKNKKLPIEPLSKLIKLEPYAKL